MRCDDKTIGVPIDSSRFQSLLGFLMRCDRMFTEHCNSRKEAFQSLLGFLMRCDMNLWGSHTPKKKFQSLLGFLMRCDAN